MIQSREEFDAACEELINSAESRLQLHGHSVVREDFTPVVDDVKSPFRFKSWGLLRYGKTGYCRDIQVQVSRSFLTGDKYRRGQAWNVPRVVGSIQEGLVSEHLRKAEAKKAAEDRAQVYEVLDAAGWPRATRDDVGDFARIERPLGAGSVWLSVDEFARRIEVRLRKNPTVAELRELLAHLPDDALADCTVHVPFSSITADRVKTVLGAGQC